MLGRKEDLKTVLERELRFLDNGGYRDPEMWRPQFVFVDSPTCVHPAGSGRPEACGECPLIGFVPKARLLAAFPCHHIPLTKEGFTVDSISRWGTHEELETALRQWLTDKIEALGGADHCSGEGLRKVDEETEAFCNHMAG